MEHLPNEIKLEILKNLKFDELIKFKQVNKYFCGFINKYKDEFAPKKFYDLSFMIIKDCKKLKFKPIEFALNNQLQDKWQFALDKKNKIPTYLYIEEMDWRYINYVAPDENDAALQFLPEKDSSKNKNNFALKLPLKPQNIEELKIVLFWLEQIFNCVYKKVLFKEFMFNPKMIKLLFTNDEIAKLKFNCRNAVINIASQNFDSWKFLFNRLVVGKQLMINYQSGDPTEEDDKILLELLLNNGDRIPKVDFGWVDNGIKLHNLLVKQMEKSKDLSKMVAKIEFHLDYGTFYLSELIFRGLEMSKDEIIKDEMAESTNEKKYYKVTNVHDSKVMFSIQYDINEGKYISYMEINRLY